jgi:hypothetical protein
LHIFRIVENVTMSMITLERWAALTYGEAAPHTNTLRRWAREARIYPVPQKHGRQYYVQPDARYMTGAVSTQAGQLLARIEKGLASPRVRR